MERRKIGGLEVSIVGVGCNNFGRELDIDASTAVVQAALEADVNFFDTADTYGGTLSEEYLGKALGSRRAEVVVATKFGRVLDDARQGAKPDYVRFAAEESLRRLGTDYIDLFQLHIPDPSTPIEDTLGALTELIQAGKVLEIGCSNFDVPQLDEASSVGPGSLQRFSCLQNEYSLLHRSPERDVLPACERLGVAFVPYFPLANGLLTGKYRRNEPPPEGTRIGDAAPARQEALLTEHAFDVIERLEAFATDRGHRLVELAFAGLLARPVVASVIAGATSPAQVRSNALAAAWKLSGEDLVELEHLAPIEG